MKIGLWGYCHNQGDVTHEGEDRDGEGVRGTARTIGWYQPSVRRRRRRDESDPVDEVAGANRLEYFATPQPARVATAADPIT